MHFDEYWDKRAARYSGDTAYTVGSRILDAEAEALLEVVTGGEVVEFGCGTGTFTRLYAPRCTSVVATDYAPQMVEQAAVALADMPNVVVRVADATATGLPCESADFVVVLNLIHIVPDPAAVLAEARRLLRPGGAVVVSSHTDEGLPLARRAAMGLRALRRFGLGLIRQRGHVTQPGLEALVAQAGFVGVGGRLLEGGSANATFVTAARG